MIRPLFEQDIPPWLEMVKEVEPIFGKMIGVKDFEESVGFAIYNREVFCYENKNGEISGVVILNRDENEIDWLAVKERSKGEGIGSLLIEKAIFELDNEKDITVYTFATGVFQGVPARNLYLKYNFKEIKKAGKNSAGIDIVLMKRKKTISQ